jgi:hypothetical protein
MIAVTSAAATSKFSSVARNREITSSKADIERQCPLCAKSRHIAVQQISTALSGIFAVFG